jgi:hypothetical protein
VLIRDSIYRLRHTSYSLNGASFHKRSNSYVNSYNFSLISSVNEKGSVLFNGEIATGFAIAIDPIIISNFLNNHFLILLNTYRKQIGSFNAQVMFDHISYLCFMAFKAKTFTVASYYNFPFFFVRSYKNLCDFFGLKPLDYDKRNLSPKKVLDQFSAYFQDLIDLGCIKSIMIDNSDKLNYNFVFVLSREYVELSAGLFSKDEAYNLLNSKPSSHETNRFFAFTKRAIKKPSILNALFPLKDIPNEEFSPEVLQEAEMIINAENEFDLPF